MIRFVTFVLVGLTSSSPTCNDVKHQYQLGECCHSEHASSVPDPPLFRSPKKDSDTYTLPDNDIVADMLYKSYGINLGRAPTVTEYNTKRTALLSNDIGGNDVEVELINSAEYDALRGFTKQGEDLSGKSFLCVGCSSGSGFWTSVRLARMGAKVYACARTQSVWDFNMAEATKNRNARNASSLAPQGQATATTARMHFQTCDTRNTTTLREFLVWARDATDAASSSINGAVVAWPAHPGQPSRGEFYDEPSWQADLAATGPRAGGRFAPINPSTANTDRFNSPWNMQGIGTIKAVQELVPLLKESRAPLVLMGTADGFLTGSELGAGTTSTAGSISTAGTVSTSGSIGSYASGVYATVARVTMLSTAQEVAAAGCNVTVVAAAALNTDRNAVGLLTYNPEPAAKDIAEMDLRTFWSTSVDSTTLAMTRSNVFVPNLFPYLWESLGGASLFVPGLFPLLPDTPTCNALTASAHLCGVGVNTVLSESGLPAAALDAVNAPLPIACTNVCVDFAACDSMLQSLLTTPQDCIGYPYNVSNLPRPVPYSMFANSVHIFRQLIASGANPIYGTVTDATASPGAYHVDAISKGIVESLLDSSLAFTYLSHNQLQKESLGATLGNHLHDWPAVAHNYERYLMTGLSHFTGRPIGNMSLERPAWKIKMF